MYKKRKAYIIGTIAIIGSLFMIGCQKKIKEVDSSAREAIETVAKEEHKEPIDMKQIVVYGSEIENSRDVLDTFAQYQPLDYTKEISLDLHGMDLYIGRRTTYSGYIEDVFQDRVLLIDDLQIRMMVYVKNASKYFGDIALGEHITVMGSIIEDEGMFHQEMMCLDLDILYCVNAGS